MVVQKDKHQVLGAVDRLGLRISTMLTAPQAQLDRRLTVHRLDTDEGQAWVAIRELIAQSEGVAVTVHDEDSFTISWEAISDHDWRPEHMDEMQLIDEPPF
ncbi:MULTISPECIES: DUF1654 domain-containing protein [unclassified Pseudomonas]|uniref:DUF1654 domain-containing protein n=1 Tax=unclassified Pseudomonas TaxID=196821 RepID=UPI000BC4CF60|nr:MULTISPECIES: DUF1654 domain-containing protein [unclassified Pseudomonas]PVZ19893.1 uncharacterized protein DUF1654 [Pseudomonas sp. URIL14HWK12:I12]PVZ26959.1 uncharacterized protein DUF1654 [Pseudomonas sp. URIL14HWK12:I10]PVZ37848.1 uncharacterized protein DUF1654 [Pseudomonas sp. URIL14HWK12:I11]SNZ05426.1 Protein of unknown function [Pseudomonas sp. URIL14HWK12:I9]